MVGAKLPHHFSGCIGGIVRFLLCSVATIATLLLAGCGAPTEAIPGEASAAQVAAGTDETRVVNLSITSPSGVTKLHPVVLSAGPDRRWSSAFLLMCNDCERALSAFGYTKAGTRFAATYADEVQLRADNQVPDDLPLIELPIDDQPAQPPVVAAFRVIDATDAATPRYVVRIGTAPDTLYTVACEDFLRVGRGTVETTPITIDLLRRWNGARAVPRIGCSSERGRPLPVPAAPPEARVTTSPGVIEEVWTVSRPHTNVSSTPYPYLVVRGRDGVRRGFPLDCGSEVVSALRSFGVDLDEVRDEKASDAELEATRFGEQPVVSCAGIGGSTLLELASPNDPTKRARFLFGRERDLVEFTCAETEDYWSGRATDHTQVPVQALAHVRDVGSDVGRARVFRIGCRRAGSASPLAYVYRDEQHVFARGPKGRLLHWYWGPTMSRPAREIWGAGDVAGIPTGFVYGLQQHVFARSVRGELLHWYWEPGGGIVRGVWGDGLAGDPTAYVYEDQEHVFARGPRGEVLHRFWYPGAEGYQKDVWGEGVTGRLTGFQWHEQQHVYARGADGQARHWWWEPGSWVQSEAWGQGFAGDPASFVFPPLDQQHLFGRGARGELLHRWWSPQKAGVDADVWGDSVASDPMGFVYADQQHVFARSVRGELAHWWWTLGDGTLRANTWGGGLVGHPAGFVYGDQQHVFAQGTDGELHHWYFAPATNQVHTETWD